MAETIGSLSIELKADIDKLKKGFEDATKSIEKLEKATEKSGQAIDKTMTKSVAFGTIIANAFQAASSAAIRFGKESFSAFLQYEQSTAVLQKRIGDGAEALVRSLEGAAQNGVTAAQAAALANRAMAFGIEQSNLVPLMELAVAKSREMGISVPEAFDAITGSIGRLRPGMLASIGILIEEDKAFEKAAKASNRLSSELTDQEKRLILQRIAVEQSTSSMNTFGGSLGTTADKMEEFNKGLGEFKRGAGGLIADVATPFVNAANKIFESKRKISEVGEFLKGTTPEAQQFFDRLREMREIINAGINAPEEVLQLRPLEFGKVNRIFEEMKKFRDINKETFLPSIMAPTLDRETAETLEMYRKFAFDQSIVEAADQIVLVQGKINEQVNRGIPDRIKLLELQDQLNVLLESADERTKRLAVSMLSVKDATDRTKNSLEAAADASERFSAKITAFTEHGTGGIRQAQPMGNGKYGDFVMRPGEGAVRFNPNDTIIGINEELAQIGGSSNITVSIPVMLDGRQIYEATQSIYQEELLRRAR